jgi:hypothetical protein
MLLKTSQKPRGLQSYGLASWDANAYQERYKAVERARAHYLLKPIKYGIFRGVAVFPRELLKGYAIQAHSLDGHFQIWPALFEGVQLIDHRRGMGWLL